MANPLLLLRLSPHSLANTVFQNTGQTQLISRNTDKKKTAVSPHFPSITTKLLSPIFHSEDSIKGERIILPFSLLVRFGFTSKLLSE